MITFVRSNGLYALAALLSLGFFYLGLLFPAEQRLRDWRFGFASHAPGGDIVLVDIDAKSISEMGTWPWPRSTYGNLVDRLNELGALEIAFDVDFSSRSSPAEDQAFADAIGRSEATVFLANFVQPSRSGSSELIVNKPIQSLNDLSWPATVNVYSDADGAVRSFPFGEQIGDEPVQSIAAVMAGYTGSLNGSFLVNFGIDVDAIDRVSLIDILNGNVEAHRISDKKIIVGAIAAELRDFFNVPKYGIISGHTLQAVAAETLASNRQLRVQPSGTVYPAVCLLGLLGMLAWRRRNWKLNLALCTGSLVVIEAVAIAVQASYSYALVTAPVHALLVISLVLTIVTEIDVGNILLRISRSQASRTKTILDRVIQDNFDGIVVVDASGAIHMANGAAAALLNIPETESENADGPMKADSFPKFCPHRSTRKFNRLKNKLGGVIGAALRRKSMITGITARNVKL